MCESTLPEFSFTTPGGLMKYPLIRRYGDQLLHDLRDLCLPGYCELAGSIRRKRPECDDIDIVCIPDLAQLFDWNNFFNNYEVLSGDPFTGKHIKFIYKAHIKCDVFVATKQNWGYMLALRTGSARFSHEILAKKWVKYGYHSEDGIIRNSTEELEFPTEESFFKKFDIPFIDPEYRI